MCQTLPCIYTDVDDKYHDNGDNDDDNDDDDVDDDDDDDDEDDDAKADSVPWLGTASCCLAQDGGGAAGQTLEHLQNKSVAVSRGKQQQGDVRRQQDVIRQQDVRQEEDARQHEDV